MLKARNSEEIKIGMTKEEAITILDKKKYEYEINNDKGSIFVKDVIISDIKGFINIQLDDKETVYSVLFYPTIENLSLREVKETRDKLVEYLTKLYGSAKGEAEDDRATLMNKKYEKTYVAFKFFLKKDVRFMFVQWAEYVTEDIE